MIIRFVLAAIIVFGVNLALGRLLKRISFEHTFVAVASVTLCMMGYMLIATTVSAFFQLPDRLFLVILILVGIHCLLLFWAWNSRSVEHLAEKYGLQDEPQPGSSHPRHRDGSGDR